MCVSSMEAVTQRIKNIRWIESCFIPFDQATDDEACAQLVCCPCYTVGAIVVLPIVVLASCGSILGHYGGSAYRVVTGRVL